MKAFTDISQGKKLAEVLPMESADMYYCYGMNIDTKIWSFDNTPTIIDADNQVDVDDIPCWSLVALLDNIPQVKLDSIKQYDKKHWRCCAYFASDWHNSDWCDNPIDACYEMVLRLNELNLL